MEMSQKQQHLHHLIGCALAYFNSVSSDVDIISFPLADIRTVCYGIISSDKSSLDIRLCVGHFLVVLSSFGQGGPLTFFNRFISSEELLDDRLVAELAQLSLFHGVICCVDSSALFSIDSNETSLGAHMLDRSIDWCTSSNDNETVVASSRIISHIISRLLSTKDKNAIQLLYNDGIEAKLLKCLWFIWEHFLDRVKHTAHETFITFLATKDFMLASEDKTEYFLALMASHSHNIPSKKSAVLILKCLVKYLSVTDILSHHPNLVVSLISSLSDFYKSGACADALKTLMVKHSSEVSVEEWQLYWVKHLVLNFSPTMMAFGFELLVKTLIDTKPSCAQFAINYIVTKTPMLEYDQMMLLISCVKMGKDVFERLLKKTDQMVFSCKFYQQKVPTEDDKWKGLISYKTLRSCLLHVDERVQILSFGLLSDSKRSSDIYNPFELTLMSEFYEYGLCVESPAQRQILAAASKKMFTRIRDSSNHLARIIKEKKDFSQTEPFQKSLSSTLGSYSSFCNASFKRFLSGLHEGCPYPERSTVLTLLAMYQNIVLASAVTRSVLSLEDFTSDRTHVQSLIEVLGDNFETNKQASLEILRNIPNLKEILGETFIQELMTRVLDMCSSCKPPVVLTSYYLLLLIKDFFVVMQMLNGVEMVDDNQSLHICHYLLKELKVQVEKASYSLINAANNAPMYGLISLIRSIICNTSKQDKKHSAWKPFVNELVTTCLEAQKKVKCIVENESPEGNIDLDVVRSIVANSIGVQAQNDSFPNKELVLDQKYSDALIKAQSVTSQMILLCGWRTVREVSLIFGELFHQFPLSPDVGAIIDLHVADRLGDYFLSVMIHTKHRGAFEQTYTGFVRMCEKLWLCLDPEMSSLPQKWIDYILGEIEAVDVEKFCATRRSAGIPFIVQAILATELALNGHECLKYTIEKLLKFATDTRAEKFFVRLHAFNILRALYRETKLGDNIIPYVSAGVMAAIKGFASEIWSIRNSATLLYSALIGRMFGVKKTRDDLNSKNAMSASVFFNRFKELYPFLLDTLSGCVSNIKDDLSPSVFPILLLLARLNPSPLSATVSSVSLTPFVSSVLTCSKSPIYQLRELSAKALPSLISSDNLMPIIGELCDSIHSEKMNSVHGALMSFLQLLEKFGNLEEIGDKEETLNRIWECGVFGVRMNCFVTKVVSLELLLQLNNLDSKFVDFSVLDTLMNDFKQLMTSNHLKYHPGFENYIIAVIEYSSRFNRTLFDSDVLDDPSSNLYCLSFVSQSVILSDVAKRNDLTIEVCKSFLDRSTHKEAFTLRCTVYKQLQKTLQSVNERPRVVSNQPLLVNVARAILSDVLGNKDIRNPKELCDAINLVLSIGSVVPEKSSELIPSLTEKLVEFSKSDTHLTVRQCTAKATARLMELYLVEGYTGWTSKCAETALVTE